MSQQKEHNKPKFFTKNRILDSLFLAGLCIIYSIVAFMNLGDDKAPQTFYRTEDDEVIAVKLKEPVKDPEVDFYTGMTKNNFNLSFASVKGCDCHINNGEILNEEISKFSEMNVSGPFRWEHKKISGDEIRVILIKNIAHREIDFGEIAVFANDKKQEVSFYRFQSNFLESDEALNVLQDESELVAREATMMNSSYFDELYFAQTAYSYATGQLGYENVHPPLGKILQSIPIAITGRMTPFTWRLMGTLTGVFIIIAVYVLAKEIFEKSSFARVAAILTALSGLHFVQTRVGTIDSYLCLFTILSYIFMVKFLKTDGKFRYFLLSGLFYGCGFAVKWSGAFGGIGLALILFAYLAKSGAWDFKKKIFKNLFSKDIRKWVRRGFLCFVIVPGVVYCSSYLLFPNTTDAHSMNDVSKQSMRLYRYHKNETTPHPYSSKWYTWPITLKPMLYEYDTSNGTSISLTGNYAIAYVSVLALLISAYFAWKKKDIQNSVIVGAWLGLWLPYALIGRTMFLYHYLPASIFAILAVVNMFYQIPGIRKIIPYYLAAVLITFIICYPKMAGV